MANRTVNDLLAGQYKSVFRGRGMEFDEVREYQPGDDIRTIDWNVTARTGTPFIKRFCEERELTVMLLVDVSASGAFGSGDQSKLELVVEVAAMLMFSALKNNDKVGLITFCDTVLDYFPPRKGKSNVLHLIRQLVSAEPVPRNTNLAVGPGLSEPRAESPGGGVSAERFSRTGRSACVGGGQPAARSGGRHGGRSTRVRRCPTWASSPSKTPRRARSWNSMRGISKCASCFAPKPLAPSGFPNHLKRRASINSTSRPTPITKKAFAGSFIRVKGGSGET